MAIPIEYFLVVAWVAGFGSHAFRLLLFVNKQRAQQSYQRFLSKLFWPHAALFLPFLLAMIISQDQYELFRKFAFGFYFLGILPMICVVIERATPKEMRDELPGRTVPLVCSFIVTTLAVWAWLRDEGHLL